MNLEKQQYFLCLEYRDPVTKQYGKSYLSFNETDLIYDVIYRYNLEQIDFFLAHHSKEELVNIIKQDNVLYFINDIENMEHINFSIRYYDNENNKERLAAPILKKECYFFDMEKYLKEHLTVSERKSLYNKLGGYLTNNHILEETKTFIQHIQSLNEEELWQEFLKLPYQEQRKIKIIAYENAVPEIQQILQNQSLNYSYSLKKNMAA